MTRAAYIQPSPTVLTGNWKVYQDPLIQSHPTGAAPSGLPSFRGNQIMSAEINPLAKVGQAHDRGCPNCGSKETVNRLRQEIHDLVMKKRRSDQKQMVLFDGVQTAYIDGAVTPEYDVCADCGTCFDYPRLDTVPFLRDQLKTLRLETESAVDSLGRLDPG